MAESDLLFDSWIMGLSLRFSLEKLWKALLHVNVICPSHHHLQPSRLLTWLLAHLKLRFKSKRQYGVISSNLKRLDKIAKKL